MLRELVPVPYLNIREALKPKCRNACDSAMHKIDLLGTEAISKAQMRLFGKEKRHTSESGS